MGAQLLDWDAAIARRARYRWQREAGYEIDQDDLVVEEPLEIRWGNLPLAVVMRTPGNDIELATGFALTEMIVNGPEQLQRVAHCSESEWGDNVVRLIPANGTEVDIARFQRNLFATSSCGICGKKSIEAALREAAPINCSATFSASVLAKLPNMLRDSQPIFQRTGALHAAALVNGEGEVQCVREDIGRHNAVDKVVGWSASHGQDLCQSSLVVSGRVSYEIVQKALAARFPCIVAVGGVSSLAVDLAQRAGISVVGFARRGSLSIYSHPERIR